MESYKAHLLQQRNGILQLLEHHYNALIFLLLQQKTFLSTEIMGQYDKLYTDIDRLNRMTAHTNPHQNPDPETASTRDYSVISNASLLASGSTTDHIDKEQVTANKASEEMQSEDIIETAPLDQTPDTDIISRLIQSSSSITPLQTSRFTERTKDCDSICDHSSLCGSDDSDDGPVTDIDTHSSNAVNVHYESSTTPSTRKRPAAQSISDVHDVQPLIKKRRTNTLNTVNVASKKTLLRNMLVLNEDIGFSANITHCNTSDLWRTSECCTINTATGIIKAIPDYSTMNTLGFCVSQRPWRPATGEHVFTVEIISHDGDTGEFAIGMVSNPMVNTQNYMFEDPACGMSYQFYLGPSADEDKESDPDGIYCFKNGMEQRKIPSIWRRSNLKENNRVTVAIDSDRRLVYFRVRGTEFRNIHPNHESIEERIESLDWYPAVVFCMENKGKVTSCRIVEYT